MRYYTLERVRALLTTLYDGPHDLDEVEERLDLVAALGRLSSTDRQLLLWRAQGYKYREIATMLGIKSLPLHQVRRAERRLVAQLSG